MHIYGAGLKLSLDIVSEIVHKTENVGAAFIKELMRRAAQASLERSAAGQITTEAVNTALAEMLFQGGQLNRKLLGGTEYRKDSSGSSCPAA